MKPRTCQHAEPAGVQGFEPRWPVLETSRLPLGTPKREIQDAGSIFAMANDRSLSESHSLRTLDSISFPADGDFDVLHIDLFFDPLGPYP